MTNDFKKYLRYLNHLYDYVSRMESVYIEDNQLVIIYKSGDKGYLYSSYGNDNTKCYIKQAYEFFNELINE